tara:strand:+ start:235 stop:618 length:384 start_codon:yes stop_codon:yes gene_type:complete
MATEILINDGGAPARILPFTAGAAITAGFPLKMSSDGEVDPIAAANSRPLGVALTTVSSGAIASVVTGHGVMLKVMTSGAAIVAGDLLATAANSNLTEAADADDAVAIALEAGTDSADTLTKVLWLN